MYLNAMIALTEKDKRVLLILFLLLIVIVAFLAVIGAIIVRVMKWQGRKLDDLCHDVVETNVIDNKKDFIRYARIKNWRTFFFQAWKPLVILVAASLILIIHNWATNDWSYNLLDYEKTGFNTLFFIWDYGDPDIYQKFFGITLISDWPPIINYPHFSLEAWASYIFFFGMLVGGAWYLVAVQCVLARTIRMYERAYNMFRKSLDGYNKYESQNQQSK